MSEGGGLQPKVAAVVFTLLVPAPMAGLIPWLITKWRFQPAFFGVEAGRWLGAIMIAVGAVALLTAIAWFAREGVKPYPPIQRVITTGPYAYTRNPMYTGVVFVMVGQGLLFGSRGEVIYGLCWFAFFHIFEVFLDDPFILKRMGKPYEDYLRAVPQWVPRRPRP